MQSILASTKTDLSRFLQSQPNIFFAKFFPVSIYRQYLSMLGFCYYGFNNTERNNLSRSMRYILGEKFGKIKFQWVLLKTYFGIFEHYLEKMINAHRSLSQMVKHLKKNISVTGKRWINEIKANQTGCILVTGHFGAVEYMPLFLAANGYRPAMIVRFKTTQLKEALVRKSQSVDLKLIDADSPNVSFQALNALKEGRVLITLCDEIHTWRPCKKENAKLFGYQIPRDRTLDILSRRAKVPAYFGVMQRKKNRYDFLIHPISSPSEKASLCEASWNLLEHYIYEHPEQWYQWPNFYSEFTQYTASTPCYAY